MGFYVGHFYPDRTGVVVKERKRRALPRVSFVHSDKCKETTN